MKKKKLLDESHENSMAEHTMRLVTLSIILQLNLQREDETMLQFESD